MQSDYSSLLLMLMFIAAGFAFSRIKLLRMEHTDALPAILLNVAYPALILSSVTSVDISSLALESIIVVVVSTVFTLLLFFGGILLLRRYTNDKKKPLIVFSMVIGNIAYVVLPVIRALFGNTGVYYAMLHSTTQDVLIWTIFYTYFVNGGTLKHIKLSKLLSPCFIALTAALLLSIFGIKLQGVIADFLNDLSAMTTPLALIYIGAVLASHKEKRDWIPDRETVLLSIGKVLLIPAAIFSIMQFVPVGPEIRLLMALFFSAPASVMSTLWAKQYGFDYRFSIKTLVFSTLLFLAATGIFIVVFGKSFV